MPKRAPQDEAIDPVRSRLAQAASAPAVISRPAPPVMQTPPADEVDQVEREPSPPPVGRGTSRPTRAPALRSGTSLSVNRKIMVTPDEADQIEETTKMISRAFGSRVTYSQISRAMWSILAGAEEAIQAGARRAPKLTAPSTGDRIAMAEYEQALTDFIELALKRS